MSGNLSDEKHETEIRNKGYIQVRYDEDEFRHKRRINSTFRSEFPFLQLAWGVGGMKTIQTKVSETENSRAVCDDGDFEVFDGVTFEDFVNVAFVFETYVETFWVDVDVRKALTSFSDNRLESKFSQFQEGYCVDIGIDELN